MPGDARHAPHRTCQVDRVNFGGAPATPVGYGYGDASGADDGEEGGGPPATSSTYRLGTTKDARAETRAAETVARLAALYGDVAAGHPTEFVTIAATPTPRRSAYRRRRGSGGGGDDDGGRTPSTVGSATPRDERSHYRQTFRTPIPAACAGGSRRSGRAVTHGGRHCLSLVSLNVL